MSRLRDGSCPGETAREEIERLRREDPTIFEYGGSGRNALSGEEYRQELRKALDNTELGRTIRGLPWGSGCGMAVTVPAGARGGYVFCVKVGNHRLPQFRHVTATAAGSPMIADDTLACLDLARPAMEWDKRVPVSEVVAMLAEIETRHLLT